jgi:hypothetical protein
MPSRPGYTPISGKGAGNEPFTIFPRDPLKEAPPRLQQAQGLPGASFTTVGGNWTPLGPAPIVSEKFLQPPPAPSSNYGNASGRLTSLVTDPNNAAVIYAGSAGGGVWKSSNGGSSWTQVTDNQPSLAIGALATDSTGQVIFAGTGEDNGSDSQAGQGILKSVNAGSSWTLVGQSTFAGHHIGGLAIDRTNSARVFAATDIGLYVSANGGSTWTLNSSYTPLLRGIFGRPLPSGAVFQIIQDPMTATKYWLVAADSCMTEAGDILTGDGGSTWSVATPSIWSLVGYLSSRLSVGVGSDNTAYMAAADCSGNFLDLERTSDGGASWTNPTISGLSNYFNLSGQPTGQGAYDNIVAVDPRNSANAVFGGVDILATSDGGLTLTNIGKVYSGGVIHPDFHALAFTATKSFYAGNDGGIWKTTNLGGTGTSSDWTNLNSNLNTVQFWQGTALDTMHFLGGAQDNGSPGNLPGAAALPAWQEYFGGDGGFTAVDPTPGSTTIYAETPQLAIRKGSSTLTGTATSPYDSFVPAAPCSAPSDPACSEPANFVAPFLMDPTNPLHLLAGTNKVYQTTNGGVPASPGGPSGWTAISNNLTSGTIFGAADRIATMVMGPTGYTNLVMTGSLFGRVFLSKNATGTSPTWTDITGNLPTFPGIGSPNWSQTNNWVSGVAVNPVNPAEAWVSIGGLNVGHVWHTINAAAGGATLWTDISGLLPNAVMDGVLLDPTRSSTIYVATDFGVMVCTQCGGSSASPNWSILGYGLPTVKVSAISLTRDLSTLIAWTHGRGAWQISIPVVNVLSAVSTQQYSLANSDGNTWMDMDSTSATPLRLTVTPSVNSVAILSGNSDLWTANPGYNQDIAIDVNGTIAAWKESGGFAGTFSPNAAMVQTVFPMNAGTTYAVKLRWKTNKPASGSSIYAGAGPISGQYSPTRLTAELLPAGSNPSTAVSTQQYSLAGSDGSTWMDMDPYEPQGQLYPSRQRQRDIVRQLRPVDGQSWLQPGSRD